MLREQLYLMESSCNLKSKRIESRNKKRMTTALQTAVLYTRPYDGHKLWPDEENREPAGGQIAQMTMYRRGGCLSLFVSFRVPIERVFPFFEQKRKKKTDNLKQKIQKKKKKKINQ
jgi:hypothetical protein